MMEIIDLTKDLVRFQTVHSKPDEIRRCAAFITQYLDALNVEYSLFDYHNSPAILAVPQHRVTPLLLMSHIDVVDAPDKLFKPVIQNGKLYGRGCYDDKYAAALSLELLKNHLQRLRKQDRGQTELPFGILITSDEETGGFNGAQKILADIQTDFCIVLDGGNLEKIVVKENGIARIKLTCRSEVSPDGTPEQKKNAVDILMNDVNTCETYFVKSAPVNPHRAIVCKHIRWEKSRHGISETAEAYLEIRYAESDDLENMFSTLEKELRSNIVVENIEPLFPGGESEHLRLLLGISKKTRVGFEDGANDSRFLSQFGIKGIVWGADGNRSQHTATEHVDIESVYELYELLDTFILRCESATSF